MIYEWIRAVLSKIWHWLSDGTQRPVWISCEYSKDGKTHLYLLANEDSNAFPGIVRLWQVSHSEATHDFFLLLINLAQCRQAMGQHTQEHEKSEWVRSFESKVKMEVQQQEYINASHIWMVAAASKQTIETQRDGGTYHHLDCCGCYLVNFQSDELRNHLPGSNRFAIHIAEIMARHLLNMTATEFDSWQGLVITYPWLEQMGIAVAHYKPEWDVQEL